MFDHGAEAIGAPVKQVFIGGVDVLQQVFFDEAFVEGGAGDGAVNEVLAEGGFEFHELIEFLGDDGGVLVVKADDHGGEDGDAVLAEFGEDIGDGAALLFGIIGAGAFIADPEAVDAHFKDFFDGVLADGFDAGEGEDGGFAAALEDASAEFEGAFFVQ